MTSVAASTPNVYFTRDPAQVAQEKYSKQTWNERYAYISMIAFTALAVIANIFLSPTVLPMTLLMFDMAVLSTASSLVLPFVMDLFAEAKKYKTQGDKEIAIAAKLQELRAMQPDALEQEFDSRDIDTRSLPSTGLQQAPELALLARIMCREKQEKDLHDAAERLKTEGKFRAAMESDLSAFKAKAKAGFFAALIQDRSLQGKFKDSFAWVDMPLEERAIAIACDSTTADNIAQTRGPSPKFLQIGGVNSKNSGIIADKLQELLAPEVTVQ